ncbi:hypothetical protein Tco_0724288 [Tanacetum coccineum]
MLIRVIPADQLVPKFQRIGRCNNYVVLQNIPCSPECKIVGQLLLDHLLSYALTTRADVLVETPTNPFITPSTIKVIEPFMQTVGYQGVCDKGDVIVQGMFILDAFITDEIRATEDYKEYEMVFSRLVPMIQTTIGLQEKLEEEDIVKMVEGDEDEESARSHKKNLENVDDDENENENKKKDDDDDKKSDDNDDHTDHTLVGNQATSSMETRKEKMQTPIPSPTRSPRTNLSSDKTLSQELTKTVSPSTATTSKAKSKFKAKSKAKPTSSKSKILPGTIAGMCRRRGLIRNHLKSTFVTNEFFMGKIQEVLDHCNNVVPELTFAKTNEMLKEEVPRLVNFAVNRDREIAPTNVPELISKEFVAHAPGIIAELFQKHMQNTTLNLYPTTSSSTTTTSTADIQHQLYLKMKSNNQDHAADPELWDILKAEITKVVRVTTDQQHGLDYMEQIIMMRENNKPDSFSEADFKYLNKNDIEDLSYQIRVNLTGPTLTFPGIEAHDPYSIVDKPNTSLIYLNNKEEKRVMHLAEIVKFCDATLERVLKEVKIKIFKSEPWKKPPLLGELDLDILKAY